MFEQSDLLNRQKMDDYSLQKLLRQNFELVFVLTQENAFP